MEIKKHIPNFITFLNLLCGCFALVFAFDNNLILSSYLVGIAAIFDFLDGAMARLLNVKSVIGKELDSLADIVSFGVVPGVILFHLIKYSHNCPLISIGTINIIPFIAFLITIFSAMRLAKFNIDDRQSYNFIGLPTPANALLIASFPLIIAQKSTLIGITPEFFIQLLTNSYFLFGVTIILSYLLVSEISLFALKFKSFEWKENYVRYLFLLIFLILIILIGFLAFPISFILYIAFSMIPQKT